MLDVSTLSREQLEALVAQLKTRTAPRKLALKVSAKGAVSLYGMGQWPVTLYAQQWERVLDAADEIKAFIDTNRDALSVKA